MSMGELFLALLQEHPGGLTTDAVLRFAGIEPDAGIGVLWRLRGRGLLRSTAGLTLGSVWTLAPDPPAQRGAYRRGAAELTAARARCAGNARSLY